MQNSILDGVNTLTWETELLKVLEGNIYMAKVQK